LKRIWLSIALLLMCLALLSSSSNAEPTRTFGFTVSAGTAISVNGSYNEAVDMPNALEAGYDYDIAFDKWIGRHFRASMTVKRFTEQGFVTLDVGFSYYFSSSN